jgi:hypothetical protein
MHGSVEAPLSETLVKGSALYSVTYNRTAWTVGAKGSIGFNIPEFLY